MRSRSCILPVMVLCMLAAVSGALGDQPTYHLVRKWGGFGSGPGQFNCPIGLAVDNDGDVFVADHRNNRIQKFDANGNYLASWVSPLGWPTGGVTVDSEGNVWATSSIANGSLRDGWVFKLTNDLSSIQGQWNVFAGSIAVDAQGNWFVPIYEEYRIEKHGPDGTLLNTWGSYGSGDGQFKRPVGISVDSAGQLYSVDAWNARVQKFSNDGTFIDKWGSYGVGDGQFVVAYGSTVDCWDVLHVADYQTGHIQSFSTDGTFLSSFDCSTPENGGVLEADWVAINRWGDMYVTDCQGHEVFQYELGDSATPELSTWALLGCSGLFGVGMLRRRRRA